MDRAIFSQRVYLGKLDKKSTASFIRIPMWLGIQCNSILILAKNALATVLRMWMMWTLNWLRIVCSFEGTARVRRNSNKCCWQAHSTWLLFLLYFLRSQTCWEVDLASGMPKSGELSFLNLLIRPLEMSLTRSIRFRAMWSLILRQKFIFFILSSPLYSETARKPQQILLIHLP